MPPSAVLALLVLVVVAAGCAAPSSRSGGGGVATAAAAPSSAPPPAFPPAPPVPDGPLDDELALAVARATADPFVPDLPSIEALGAGGDPRVLWLLSDLLRFAGDEATVDTVTDAASRLAGVDLREGDRFPWVPLTDHLLAWDLPAFEGYVEAKAAIFTAHEPRWQPFFDASPSAVDWRLVSWGGVRIDDRPLGDPQPCAQGCIPALDDPALVPAAQGGWYPDDGVVFGVLLGGEAVALPRNVMEVHELVNATIGGRRVGIPYCTLCGAAQAFLLDDVAGVPAGQQPVLRTSGLLRRSNKVMYDLTTGSLFDTFTGAAVSGPLLEAGVVLEQATVVTTTWAAWREAHPATTIVAEDGGIGRSYPADPLGGRDDDGPIFPVGERDGRLDVHEQVVGVVLDDGTAVAFPAAAARAALADGRPVAAGGVALRAEAGGLVAEVDGQAVPSHQAFWFAWSQFHPRTLLWAG